MLHEQELKTFVEGTTSFFEVAAQQPASIGSPYLLEGTPAMHEYTGVINISGKREGVVIFTAPKAMLTVLLMKMQENDFSHETMRDLVGEVANTSFRRSPACALSSSRSTGAVTRPSWSSP